MSAPPTRQGTASYGRGWLVLAGLAYLAFVVYGSLVPLNFRPMPLSQALAAFKSIPYLQLGIGSRADWVANILLFIPLAFLWTGALWTPRHPEMRIVVAIAVFAACFALSVAIEFTQLFFPGRTVSLNDIVAEGMGGACGIALWGFVGTRFMGWISSLRATQSRTGVAERLLFVYLFLMIAYNVMPLDLTISPVEMYHKWREGRVLIVPFSAPFTDLAQLVYGWTSDVAIWVPLAFLWRLSRPMPAYSVWLRIVAVATLIEFLQLFVYSRVSDSTDIILAAVGGAIGIWLAELAKGHDRTRGSPPVGSRIGPSNPAWPWLAATVFWLVVLAVVFWYPFNFDFHRAFLRERLLGLKQVPFEAYYFGSEYRALTEVLHKTGFMLPLGLLLGGMAAGRRIRVPREVVHAAAVLFIVAVAATIEVVQVTLPGKNADLTDWLLEAAGGIAGYVAFLACYSRFRLP
jgi:VanZ family protein